MWRFLKYIYKYTHTYIYIQFYCTHTHIHTNTYKFSLFFLTVSTILSLTWKFEPQMGHLGNLFEKYWCRSLVMPSLTVLASFLVLGCIIYYSCFLELLSINGLSIWITNGKGWRTRLRILSFFRGGDCSPDGVRRVQSIEQMLNLVFWLEKLCPFHVELE